MGNDWAEFGLLASVLGILKHGNFRVASQEMHVTQSSLSRAAKKFHVHFGALLYTLGKDKRMHLNRVGLAFREMIPILFEVRDELLAALLAIARGGIRELRLGCETIVDPDLFHTACQIHKRFLPDCAIHPFSEDAEPLMMEVLSGEIDAAIVTLPVHHPDLCVETIRRDRLVVCLRADGRLAAKAAVHPADLRERPGVLPHPQQHPAAYARLNELLAEAGVQFQGHGRASHPSGMQQFVLDGYGVALIREGTALQSGLTTRPIAGVPWTVDTAFVYDRKRHPKTIPPLVRELKKRAAARSTIPGEIPVELAYAPRLTESAKHPIQCNRNAEVQQLSLFGEFANGAPAGMA